MPSTISAIQSSFVQGSAPVVVNPGKNNLGDYDRLSQLADKVIAKGRKLRRDLDWHSAASPTIFVELLNRDTGNMEQYAVTVSRRMTKSGAQWIASFFDSSEDKTKSRRVIAGPDGKVYMLLDAECKAIFSANKYARQFAALVGGSH